MKDRDHRLRILAIDPTPKGFGFAVLERGGRLVDWGVARVWATSEMEFVARVDAIISMYRPALVIVPEIPAEPHRARSARRVSAVSAHARARGKQIVVMPPSEVKAAFPGTKHARAELLATQFPELQPWLPRIRRPWMTEDERMHIFDAVSLIVTMFTTAVRRV